MLSVVVPVLDEAARIGAQLDRLAAQPGVGEVVVVDGGSADDTVAIARRASNATVIVGPRGRGTQLNAGARAARGDVLLFLHADVTLPRDAVAWVDRTLAAPEVVAGAFVTRTVNDGPPSVVSPFLWLADMRSRVTRFPYGDQAMFVRRAAFERAGGFPEQPLLEDLELSWRLARLGRIARVPVAVTVSGRRFIRRPLASLVILRILPVLYRCGVSPARLVRLYGNLR